MQIRAKSLYVHIPFCQRRCNYCDFYSSIYQPGLASDFITILITQIKTIKSSLKTIYVGGGTPTVLSLSLLSKLFGQLSRLVAKRGEITVEANPESLTQDKVKLLRDQGVNRISIGCQSFQDAKLKFLGRQHDAVCARLAVEKVKKSRFSNISIDLIFGLPGESCEIWQKDLSTAVSLPVEHISTYMLGYEPKTKLQAQLRKNKFLPLEEKEIVRLYDTARLYLPQNKFKQYEISNFCQKGFSCRHNLSYWKNEAYIGLGPGAVSFTGEIRRKNIPCLPKYMKAVKEKQNFYYKQEKLSKLKRAKETAAIKIRTLSGINLTWFQKKTGYDLRILENKPLKKLKKEGLIAFSKDKERVFLTFKGVLFADSVSSELI